jgi:hypothetical protein
MTYTPAAVASPARLPWTVEEVAVAALDVLRLDASDQDAARVAAAADSATVLVDSELDLEVAPTTIPGPVFDAAVTLTVELYRRKDAPFGVSDSWSVDGAAIHLSADVMRGVRSTLNPFVGRRGIA